MYELPATHPLHLADTGASPLVRALRGERPERLPVWFMRQAGRSLPEYRELRTGRGMLETCVDPALASEITLQPVRRHDVDAAIFFSDIVVPLSLAGVDVTIEPGRGPVFGQPVRTADDVRRMRTEHSRERLRDALGPIREAVALTTSALGSRPLIGFAGAPFTLAAYLVEGGPSRDHLRARALMHSDPETWRSLLEWAADLSGEFLRAQIEAGASAAQLFDSWAGSLSAEDYREHVAGASLRAIAPVRDLGYRRDDDAGSIVARVPVIHFAVGSGHLLEELAAISPDALGVDWRTPLSEASARLGDTMPLQGNLDPALLFAPEPVRLRHLDAVIAGARRAPSHVLNLGHGVPPETDPDVLTSLVRAAHER